MKTSRLVTVVAVFVLAGTHADAQFQRGLPASQTEISLFPVIPPVLLLPAGSFEVEVRNLSSAPARLLPRLDEVITTQMSGNDPRLEAAGINGQLQVVATVTAWTHTRRHGRRFVPEVRLMGTQIVANADGSTQPLYDYGRDKPNVVDTGAATVRVEVRRGNEAIADETARIEYQSDRLEDEGPPSVTEFENALLERAAHKSAGLLTPSREAVKVPLARSEEVERLNQLAVNGWWGEWRTALQDRPPHRDAKRDAYRLYNLGVAFEAMAYEATTPEETLRLLQEAAGAVQQAMTARKDEKAFAESLARLRNNTLGYTRLRTMLASMTR